MAARLKSDSSLLREIDIEGIGTVVVEMSSSGLRIRPKGSKHSVFGFWRTIIDNGCQTPEDVPAYLHGRPIEYIKKYSKK